MSYTNNWLRHRNFCNPNTGIQSRITKEDRLEVVRQFILGELSTDQIVQRYQLSSPQVLYGWIGRSIEETLQLKRDEESAESQQADGSTDQSKEIERLRKALELEKLRSAGYCHMIELAEKQFNIPIRKKFGTKR